MIERQIEIPHGVLSLQGHLYYEESISAPRPVAPHRDGDLVTSTSSSQGMIGPGDFARRPRVRTPFGGLVLAGDGIRIDVPAALMERAATTGFHAANCLLARWGLAGHELYTVPVRGRFAPLRALAGRARPAARLSAADQLAGPRPKPLKESRR